MLKWILGVQIRDPINSWESVSLGVFVLFICLLERCKIERELSFKDDLVLL